MEKIVFMQTSKTILGIVPNTVHIMDFTSISDRITSQKCIGGTLLRCSHAIRTLVLDNCSLATKSSHFNKAISNMSLLNVFSAVGTRLPYSILFTYVIVIIDDDVDDGLGCRNVWKSLKYYVWPVLK